MLKTPSIVFLKPGREKSVIQRHPWIFSGAIDRIDGNPELGQTVRVLDSKGEFLGWAAFSPNSQIRLRFWSFANNDIINDSFFTEKITKATSLRKDLIENPVTTNAYRLIHAESDNLPGLIVDIYDTFLVIQILAAGIEYHREIIIAILKDQFEPEGIFERSDVSVRNLEGLEPRIGCLAGREPPKSIQIIENGYNFNVDIQQGQKTGFYLDQRENRKIVSHWVLGHKVLNCFSYSGGFTVFSLKGGASSVMSVDSSSEAIELAKDNIKLNQLDLDKCEWKVDDVFMTLRCLRDRAQKFDTIILDPPKFAPTASLAHKAARAYKDINLLAFKLLNPGGSLFTFSCSGGINSTFFQKIVAQAAQDAGVDAKVITYLHQGPDHPVSLNFPEGEYLKGIHCII